MTRDPETVSPYAEAANECYTLLLGRGCSQREAFRIVWHNTQPGVTSSVQDLSHWLEKLPRGAPARSAIEQRFPGILDAKEEGAAR